MERRRFLHRSIRSQVRTQSSISFFIIRPYQYLCRFERELEALRKELADATARSGRSSPTDSYAASHGTGPSDEDLVALNGSPIMMNKPLPSIVTPETMPIALPVDKKTA